MADNDLGLPERAAMLALMAAAREMSNTELKSRTGFALSGKACTKLNQLGLVDTVRKPTPFVHTLTDKGWRWCADELTAQTPPKAGSAGGALYAVLAGLHRYLVRADLQLADVFQPDHVTEPPSDADVEEHIRSAYRRLAKEPRDWVSLAELRPLLGGLPRSTVDATLTRMIGMPRVNLVPESNQKALKQRHIDAAVHIGGEDKHLISIAD